MVDFAAHVQKGQPNDIVDKKMNSWEDVALTVESMMNRLKTKQESGKFRRATNQLRRFCNTINAHSTALKMLPTNNDYISIFYGALSTALRVRTNQVYLVEAMVLMNFIGVGKLY